MNARHRVTRRGPLTGALDGIDYLWDALRRWVADFGLAAAALLAYLVWAYLVVAVLP